MKYDMTARVYGLIFRRIQEEYKAMLERTPGVGGKENSLEDDLIGACWFFALAKADPDMSPERMDDVIVSGIQSNFMQKSHRKERENGRSVFWWNPKQNKNRFEKRFGVRFLRPFRFSQDSGSWASVTAC